MRIQTAYSLHVEQKYLEATEQRDEAVNALRLLYTTGFSINMSDAADKILAKYPEQAA